MNRLEPNVSRFTELERLIRVMHLEILFKGRLRR